MGEFYLEVKRQIARSIILKCYNEQNSILRDKIGRLMESGISGSILVLGSRGSGKTTLVDNVVNDYESNLLIIQLNGFLHNDEKLVINEIGRQLDVKVDVEDENFSVSDSLQRILSSICNKKGGKKLKPKSVLFVLDEFDRFTSSAHQNFLYNVLDKTTSNPNPDDNLRNISIFVIGISSRLDVVELLEKRVRSRLSQKQLLLFSDWTLEEYVSFVQQLLNLSSDSPASKKVIKIWNDSVRACLKNTDVLKILKNHYFKNKSIQSLKHLLMLAVGRINRDRMVLEPEHFSTVIDLFSIPDDCLLKCLSMLEICLLLAAKRHIDNAGDDENLNFEVIYQEYRKFTQKYAKNLNYTKEVASKAFENLLEYEFFVPSNENGSHTFLGEFKTVRIQLDTNFLVDFVQKLDCSDVVKHWANDRLA